MAGGKWLPAALLAGVCIGSLTMARGAAAATIDPTPATVIAGDSITLTLSDTVSGVAGVTLVVTYDPALLTVTSVTNGTLLATWDAPVFNLTTGQIGIIENDLSDDADGTGSIVNLTFAATVTDPTGIATVTIRPSLDPNSTAGQKAAAIGQYEGDTVQKSINITAVSVTPPATLPEPGTVVLLLAPLLAAASLKLRARP